jgi:hypothetical protein
MEAFEHLIVLTITKAGPLNPSFRAVSGSKMGTFPFRCKRADGILCSWMSSAGSRAGSSRKAIAGWLLESPRSQSIW